MSQYVVCYYYHDAHNTHTQTHTQITKLTLGKQLVIHFFNSAMKYLLRAWLCSLCSEEYNVVRSGGWSVNTQHPSTQWMPHDHMIQTIFNAMLQSTMYAMLWVTTLLYLAIKLCDWMKFIKSFILKNFAL